MTKIFESLSNEIFLVYARPRNDNFISDDTFWDEIKWALLGSYWTHDEAVTCCHEHQKWRQTNHSYVVVKKVTSYFPDTVRHLNAQPETE